MDFLLALVGWISFTTVACVFSGWIRGKPSRLFRWLSMTGDDGADACTERSLLVQTARGASVYLTFLFAWLSGGYAAHLVFGDPRVAAGLGLLYALFIGTIDRLIVGSNNRWLALARLPLAVAIGITIAVPVELKMAEDQIRQHLRRKATAENDSLRKRLRAQKGLPRLTDRITSLRSKQEAARESAKRNRRLARCELTGGDMPGCTGDAGKGDAYQAARRRARADSMRAARIERRLRKLATAKDSARRSLKKTYASLKKSPDAGLYTSYAALGKIKQKSSSARHLSWGIMFLFVLLEVTPALMKMLTKTDYDRIQHAFELANAEIESARIEEDKQRKIDSIYQGRSPQQSTPHFSNGAANGTQSGSQSRGSSTPPDPNIVMP